ncbi:hypothetical protein [Fundidesulfovibrio soli]|uniref:hypothetical protein n=1 Tax=Fundidesulfovibrio soli TaxID=2922716 RepID=UPI001FB02DF8|nr:hypothetical protein [Fundidesulfovibrio soli]
MFRNLAFALTLMASLSCVQANAAETVQNATTARFEKNEPFSVHTAMRVIYGQTDENDASFFKPEFKPRGPYEIPEELIGTMLVASPVAYKELEESGTKKVYMVTSAIPAEGKFFCRICYPVLGLFVFEHRDGRWGLTVYDKDLVILGGYGSSPEVAFVQIGPSRWAVAFTKSDAHLGHNYFWVVLYAVEGGAISEVFEGLTFDEYDGDETDCTFGPSYRYDVDLFTVHSSGDYYGIKSATKGTIPQGANACLPSVAVSKEEYFQYDTKLRKYVPAQMTEEIGPVVPLGEHKREKGGG